MATVRRAIAVDTDAGRDRQIMDNWTYYRLHSEEGHVIGFLRTDGNVEHWVDMRSDRWSTVPIGHYERVRVARPLPCFGYLEDTDGQ